MRVGLLGFSQSGKRTLFSLLTGHAASRLRQEDGVVEGIAAVRDSRVDTLAKLAKPERTKYAEIHAVLCPDVALSSDERDWLDIARRCDLLCGVIRAFSAAEVYHPQGSVDPDRDRRNLASELLLADLELVEKRLERLGKEKRAGQTPTQAMEEKVLEKCRSAVENGHRLDTAGLEPHEIKAVKSLEFLTLLPILWTYNVDESGLADSPGKGPDAFVVSGPIEREIMEMPDAEERSAYLLSLGLGSSGLERLSHAAYDMLGLMSFYTIGPDEVRAWTIRKGTKAPEAAGKIHRDIERGFIRVEVIKYDDLVAAGGEDAAKKAGRVQVKGRDYVIEDGDVCHFRFNV
jgi:ribosome-binding ATPase